MTMILFACLCLCIVRLAGTYERFTTSLNEKKAPREMQTLCTVGDKNACPATDPLPGDEGWPKFNQLEMVTTFTYKPSLVRIDACNFELSL